MTRREILSLAPGYFFLPQFSAAQEAPEPISEPHFPSPLYEFVWRNWELANADRIAKVLRTTAAAILELGASMGLPKKPHLADDQLTRLYITVIRQNWHLLPEEQIVELLGWTRDRFQFALKEDDFLDIKLGLPKPRCSELVYHAPSAAEKMRAREVRATVHELFGDSINRQGEELFHFVKLLSDSSKEPLRDDAASARPGEVDLTRGWGLIAGADLAQPAQQLRSYLRQVMGAALSPGKTANNIKLAVDPAQVSGTES